MQVLAVASEIYPLVKTGGLADVAGALPLALKPLGIRTRTLVPGYPSVLSAVQGAGAVVCHRFDDLLGEEATVHEVEYNGLDLLILDAPALYDRAGGPYLDLAGIDHSDNWKRFAVLSKAAAEIAAGVIESWRPDLIHAHDWQAAMVPVYMRYGVLPELPSALTIHNIAFQGQFSSSIFVQLDLPPHAFSMEGVEYYGDVGFLKGGLQTTHAITTVSPSYAGEILTPTFGMGMEGLIAARVADLHGIVNGIDTHVWDPATDPTITANYSASAMKRRAANRRAVTRHFGLIDDGGPLFCVVSRLTWQKGMDLLADAADQIAEHGGMLAILGSGDAALEEALMIAAARHPGRVSVVIGYNEWLSHLIQSGADAILIPSRFEPCGLTQLYGLRYGCIPIVARTGGLVDTVIDANEAALSARVATGFQFAPINAEGLRQVLRRVFKAWHEPKVWARIQNQGMKSDVSWENSAARYADLYSSLLSRANLS